MDNNEKQVKISKNEYSFDVEIAVNDRNVPLNDFSEKLVARTIYGMLSALKQVPRENEIEKIEIIINKNAN